MIFEWVSECVDLYSALTLRTFNALLHSYRANKYDLSRRLKQSVLLVGSRIKSASESSGQHLRKSHGRKC